MVHPCLFGGGGGSLSLIHVLRDTWTSLSNGIALATRVHFIINRYKKTTGKVVSLFVWWRRRESNSRPQILRRWLYMLIPPISLTLSYPTGREGLTRFR